MESPLWVLWILHTLASHCVPEVLECPSSTLLAAPGSPEQRLPPGPRQRWVRDDCGILNSCILHSEVNFLGWTSFPKSCLYLCLAMAPRHGAAQGD